MSLNKALKMSKNVVLLLPKQTELKELAELFFQNIKDKEKYFK